MPWSEIAPSPETIVETVAGDGILSSFYPLNPKATKHVMVTRNDPAAAADQWGVSIYGALEAGNRSTTPIIGPQRLTAANKKVDFFVGNVRGYFVFVQNLDGTPIDEVQALLQTLDDGVNL